SDPCYDRPVGVLALTCRPSGTAVQCARLILTQVLSQSCPSRSTSELDHQPEGSTAMTSLALERTDVIVGVDTHKDEHVAFAIDGLGGRLADPLQIPA